MRMRKRRRRRKMRPRTCWEEVLGQHCLQKGREWVYCFNLIAFGHVVRFPCPADLGFSAVEWDDCRREAESTSKRTGSSAQRGGKEAINWTERRAADSEVRVCREQSDCPGVMWDLQKFLKKKFFVPTPELANLTCPIKTHLWCLRNHTFGKWRSISIRNMRL